MQLLESQDKAPEEADRMHVRDNLKGSAATVGGGPRDDPVLISMASAMLELMCQPTQAREP